MSFETCIVSMFTTAGSTRLAISTNEAESASGARAADCGPSWATAGRPARMAPMPMPASTQTTAMTAIQTRSFRRIVASASVVCLKDSNMIHRLRNLLIGYGSGDIPAHFPLSGGSRFWQYSERQQEKLEVRNAVGVLLVCCPGH